MIEKRRIEAREELAITQAWLTARLSRAQKIPSLDKLLTRRRRQHQTVEQQRSALDLLATMYGGRVRRRQK